MIHFYLKKKKKVTQKPLEVGRLSTGCLHSALPTPVPRVLESICVHMCA